MKIRLDYQDRILSYQIEGAEKAASGEGIAPLLKAVEGSQKISEIKVSGVTKSYTFARQVYLVANLLRLLSGSTLIINGEKVRGLALPDYS